MIFCVCVDLVWSAGVALSASAVGRVKAAGGGDSKGSDLPFLAPSFLAEAHFLWRFSFFFSRFSSEDLNLLWGNQGQQRPQRAEAKQRSVENVPGLRRSISFFLSPFKSRSPFSAPGVPSFLENREGLRPRFSNTSQASMTNIRTSRRHSGQIQTQRKTKVFFFLLSLSFFLSPASFSLSPFLSHTLRLSAILVSAIRLQHEDSAHVFVFPPTSPRRVSVFLLKVLNFIIS